MIFGRANEWTLARARSLADRGALEQRALVIAVGEAVRHSGLLQAHVSAERRWVVGHFTCRDCVPFYTGEERVLLYFFDAGEADPHCGLLREELLYEILGLRVNIRLVELDLLALLDIVIGFEIGSALERSLTAQELVEDDSERPVVARVAQLAHVAQSLGGEVLLCAHEGVHALVNRVHDCLAIV